MSSNYLIIVGAGRSGTNALRDALCELDDFGTWPCDEINYIWRFGNRDYPTDELTAAHASDKAKNYIRHQFEKQHRKLGTRFLVEKTCASSLRVEFVDEIFPEARFVNIVRDGRDVAASAAERWTAPLDVPYLARKARFVPRRDLPVYAMRYVRTRLDRLRSDDDRLSWWGPKFDGMEQLGPDTPLVEVAARQWAASVLTAHRQLAEIPDERVMNVSYKDFVAEPADTVGQIASWMGAVETNERLDRATAGIHARSIGSWKKKLNAEDQALVNAITSEARDVLGIAD